MLALLIPVAFAAPIEVTPEDDLFAILAGLTAGDEVILQGGTYSTQSSSGSWFRELDLQGTESAPIIIRAAEDETPILQGDPAGSENVINVSGQWYTLQGLEFIYGSHGVRVYTSAHATFEDLHIHDVMNVGLSMNVPGNTYEDMTVRGCEIHDTSGDTGECMYLGCNEDDCQVWDSMIEFNYCHDLQAAGQGDGIELKTGSYNVTIRHNVITDTNYPGITMYGTLGRGVNIVEGNVVARTLDHGIQVVGEVEVRNNIVIDAGGYGIYSKSSQGSVPTDLLIAHNTVIDAGTSCLRANNWDDGGTDIVIANNVLFCPDGDAIRLPDGVGVGSFVDNAVLGVDEAPSGTFEGSLSDVLDAGSYDLYPSEGSALIDEGTGSFATTDFNCLPRDNQRDVGAYEWLEAENPGWALAADFKQCAEVDDSLDTGRDPLDTGTADTGETGLTDTDGGSTGADDGGTTGTEPTVDTGDAPEDEEAPKEGCGCDAGVVSGSVMWLWLMLPFVAARRRR